MGLSCARKHVGGRNTVLVTLTYSWLQESGKLSDLQAVAAKQDSAAKAAAERQSTPAAPVADDGAAAMEEDTEAVVAEPSVEGAASEAPRADAQPAAEESAPMEGVANT